MYDLLGCNMVVDCSALFILCNLSFDYCCTVYKDFVNFELGTMYRVPKAILEKIAMYVQVYFEFGKIFW